MSKDLTAEGTDLGWAHNRNAVTNITLAGSYWAAVLYKLTRHHLDL